MAYLVEFPVEDSRLIVEADDWQLPDELELAARRPGEVVTQAVVSLEHSLDQLKPAMTAVAKRLKAMSPDSFSVEFGLVLSAEYGLVVAKGSGDIHFNVTMSWHGSGDEDARPGQDG